MKKDTGFFAKIRDDFYAGPYNRLNEARDEARKYGGNIPIYHGTLKRISEDIFDDQDLFLIPKPERK